MSALVIVIEVALMQSMIVIVIVLMQSMIVIVIVIVIVDVDTVDDCHRDHVGSSQQQLFSRCMFHSRWQVGRQAGMAGRQQQCSERPDQTVGGLDIAERLSLIAYVWHM